MKAFDVSVSSKGETCLLRVDGLRNALWLLERLSQFFVFKTSEAFHEGVNSSSVSFSVIHSFRMTQPKFERLLVSIPAYDLNDSYRLRRTKRP